MGLTGRTGITVSHLGRRAVGAQTDMPGNFLTVVITDPHQANRVLWENLSARKRTWLDERQFCSIEFEPLDRRRFRLEPESFRSEFWTPTVGPIRVSRAADSCATQLVQRAPGFDSYCVSFIARGASRLIQPRSR